MVGDPGIEAIGLILEDCRDGRSLVEAVQAATSAGRRVVMLKLATNRRSAFGAQSHTGAIVGRFDVFRQVLTEAGALVCSGPRQFVAALTMCGRGMVPRGLGVGVISGSGGLGVLAGDIAVVHGLNLPLPVREPSAQLREQLPLAVLSNTMDISTRQVGIEATVTGAVGYIADQSGVDCILVYQPHGLHNPRLSPQLRSALLAANAEVDLPLFVCGEVPADMRQEFAAARHLKAVEYPENVLEVVRALAGARRRRQGRPSTLRLWSQQPVCGGRGRRARLAGVEPGIELVRQAIVPTGDAARRFVQALAAGSCSRALRRA